MDQSFHSLNRTRLYETVEPQSLLVAFAGAEIRRSADAYYPFYADRNFVYLTGMEQKESILVAYKAQDGTVSETLYLLPKDFMKERWTGRRLDADEAYAKSGIREVKSVEAFAMDFHRLAVSGRVKSVWLDLYKESPEDIDKAAHRFAAQLQKDYPQLTLRSCNAEIRRLRTIKQPSEIEALRRAEEMTRAGILAMMKASRPGMYEYQYKAEFDRALGQFGPWGAGFASIISAGENNFCIHYDSYTGQAQDGDMVLNDVGAQYDGMITDVSRGFPVNGKFSERQRLLYECALATSDYLFSLIRPGMRMADVDQTIRAYNAQKLVEAGVMESVDQVGTYMWHGGAHHIGYDVHDAVQTPDVIEPGMVFCVDVGIYHEEWGIGFRLEDNCLVTQDGCENLSRAIPRTIEEIEEAMR